MMQDKHEFGRNCRNGREQLADLRSRVSHGQLSPLQPERTDLLPAFWQGLLPIYSTS